jgi:hypothetical protein
MFNFRRNAFNALCRGARRCKERVVVAAEVMISRGGELTGDSREDAGGRSWQ